MHHYDFFAAVMGKFWILDQSRVGPYFGLVWSGSNNRCSFCFVFGSQNIGYKIQSPYLKYLPGSDSLLPFAHQGNDSAQVGSGVGGHKESYCNVMLIFLYLLVLP